MRQIAFASLVGVEPQPFAPLLAAARERGITAVEVNSGPNFAPIAGAEYGGHLDLEAVVRDGPGAVQETLAAHGAEIVALAPMLNALTPDTALRERRVAYLRTAIAACAVLGVPRLVTYGGSAFGMHFTGLPGLHRPHPSDKTAENLAVFTEIYGPLAQLAEERGVRICFETAPRGGGEGNLAHSPDLWERLFAAVPSPALGLSFDPSHLRWLHIADIPAVIRDFRERMYHVDGKDCEVIPGRLARQGVMGNSWWRYRLPGRGDLDWGAIFAALDEIGYDGPVSIENEDPDFLGLDGVAWSAEYLREQQRAASGERRAGNGE